MPEFLNPQVSSSALHRSLRRHEPGGLRPSLPCRGLRRGRRGCWSAPRRCRRKIPAADVGAGPPASVRRHRPDTGWVSMRISQDNRQRTRIPARPGAARAKDDHPRVYRQWQGSHRSSGGPPPDPTGNHDFAPSRPPRHRASLGLAWPKHPQANGRVKRLNSRNEDVLQSHHFNSGQETLLDDLQLQPPAYLISTKGRTSLAAPKDWQRRRPTLQSERMICGMCDMYDGKSVGPLAG